MASLHQVHSCSVLGVLDHILRDSGDLEILPVDPVGFQKSM